MGEDLGAPSVGGGSRTSSATDSARYSAPANPPGRTSPPHPSSEPAIPMLTPRASFLRLPRLPVCRCRLAEMIRSLDEWTTWLYGDRHLDRGWLAGQRGPFLFNGGGIVKLLNRHRIVSMGIAIGLCFSTPIVVQAATWQTYRDGLLSTTYLHGGSVTSVSGYSMTLCSGGSWTKFVAVYNGGFVVHNHQYQGLGCFNAAMTSYGHNHPSSYGVCKSISNVSPNYARCHQLNP